MTSIERARKLRTEADEVLALIDLQERCRHIGELTATGSYFLCLMIYPDIDLYLPATTTEAMMALAADLAQVEAVTQLVFLKGEPGDLADGLYLKPVVRYGAWERKSKIDIWALSDDIIQQKEAELTDLKARMTEAQRRMILDYKLSILNEEGRTPRFSGLFIYRAVVNMGMTDFPKIAAYLRENGIAV